MTLNESKERSLERERDPSSFDERVSFSERSENRKLANGLDESLNFDDVRDGQLSIRHWRASYESTEKGEQVAKTSSRVSSLGAGRTEVNSLQVSINAERRRRRETFSLNDD
jgi:hypothetical protein